ncbi:MAG: DUF3240 family protein [Gammaproteobacteria bacterium]
MSTFTDVDRLTLVFPPAVEPALLEILLDEEPPLPGFTVVHAEGHGADFEHATVRERVRGRVARRMLLMVLPHARVEHLLERLRARLPSNHVTWWVEPVSGFGRLA